MEEGEIGSVKIHIPHTKDNLMSLVRESILYTEPAREREKQERLVIAFGGLLIWPCQSPDGRHRGQAVRHG